jgi:hypothetical protein
LKTGVFWFKKVANTYDWMFSLDECCRNFLKPDCSCIDIVLYIQLGSERLSICKNCWCELAVFEGVGVFTNKGCLLLKISFCLWNSV